MIAFSKGWLLTLVMLSSIPPLMISGGVMSQVVAKMASRGQNAYAAAAIIVEQTIGAIRTVSTPSSPCCCIYMYSMLILKRVYIYLYVCVFPPGCLLYWGEEGCN